MLKSRTDRETLEIERGKLRDAQEKTRIEGEKAVWTSKFPIWIAGVSVVVSAISIAVTAIVGYYTQTMQAQKDFQIKAAELVLKAGSAKEAKANAELLETLFSSYLGEKFSERFKPVNFQAFGTDVVQAKTEFLKLLLSKDLDCKQKSDAVVLWKQLFNEDTVFKDRTPTGPLFELPCQEQAIASKAR